jgi:DNA-binding beta-propeller fold protein YncE
MTNHTTPNSIRLLLIVFILPTVASIVNASSSICNGVLAGVPLSQFADGDVALRVQLDTSAYGVAISPWGSILVANASSILETKLDGTISRVGIAPNTNDLYGEAAFRGPFVYGLAATPEGDILVANGQYVYRVAADDAFASIVVGPPTDADAPAHAAINARDVLINGRNEIFITG